MSGICGLVALNDAPLDCDLLARINASQVFRGPDSQAIWADQFAGLGHASLTRARPSDIGPQPCSLDGKIWITADARIDGRKALAAELCSAGKDV